MHVSHIRLCSCLLPHHERCATSHQRQEHLEKPQVEESSTVGSSSAPIHHLRAAVIYRKTQLVCDRPALRRSHLERRLDHVSYSKPNFVVSHGIKASTFVIVSLCVLLIQHTEPRFAGGVEAAKILRRRRRRCTVHLIVLHLERAAKHILV